MTVRQKQIWPLNVYSKQDMGILLWRHVVFPHLQKKPLKGFL